MSNLDSLADALVRYMRTRDEAKAKADAIPKAHDAYATLGILIERQDDAVRDALRHATDTAFRAGQAASATANEHSAKVPQKVAR